MREPATEALAKSQLPEVGWYQKHLTDATQSLGLPMTCGTCIQCFRDVQTTWFLSASLLRLSQDPRPFVHFAGGPFGGHPCSAGAAQERCPTGGHQHALLRSRPCCPGSCQRSVGGIGRQVLCKGYYEASTRVLWYRGLNNYQYYLGGFLSINMV